MKKNGKASSISETIGAGGEDATSNSDNNELVLISFGGMALSMGGIIPFEFLNFLILKISRPGVPPKVCLI